MKKIAFLLVFIPTIALSQFEIRDNKTLSITGTAYIKQIPEMIIVSIEIIQRDSNYNDCFRKAFNTLETFKDALTENNLDKDLVQTKEIVINENVEYQNGVRKIDGYVALIRLVVESKYSKVFAEKLFKSLQEYSVEASYNVKFKLSEEQKQFGRHQALELAIIDAMQRAETVIKAAGIEVSGIESISDNDRFSSSFYISDDDDIVSEFRGLEITRRDYEYKNLNFNPTEITLARSMNIIWRIKQK